MNLSPITKLIADNIEDTEVREVAIYAAQRELISMRAEVSVNQHEKTISGLTGDQLLLVLRMEDGNHNNQFFINNYAAIKTFSQYSGMVVQTRNSFGAMFGTDPDAKVLVKNLLVQRFQILPFIVMLGVGMKEALEFNMELQRIVKLTPQEELFFATNR